ncbi:MAG: exodeoxyribonuclease V subunit gamma [Fluviicoccus sp.]|uniref:exodeoxyribonuclease V subunit gamma n=1 Tax=Fluviicoccus sp. TaxID=2003552 RepID=UPI00272772B1|nr:exodeoxyribonuclease V subunit gamma [Fluviicoccus sp.]MDO8329649.1 exodeoxyribonuclease V subunit gamma [Fluviicoccus sp.]
MLTITQSHHLPTLFDALSLFLGEPVDDPLQPLTVLVPSIAVGRWLELRWAERFGIAAHFKIQYPASFLWECYQPVLDSHEHIQSLPKELMQWRLFERLATLPEDDPDFAALRHYLQRTPQPVLGRWQLAGRIASAFADYISYRPDWMETWGRGERLPRDWPHQAWQARLWLELFADTFGQGRALFPRYFEALQASPELQSRLPQRLAVFTTVRLPPQVLHFYQSLAPYAELHWYHLNPSREYWADVVDERWLEKMRVLQPEKVEFHSAGHPLLVAWGKQARDNFRLLSELSGGEHDNVWRDLFPPIIENSLLNRLQHSIHTLEHQHADSELPVWPLEADDVSLQVHSCHSLTRQLEVLHDRLLDLFARHPDLKPQDVVVMLPDVVSASGAIESVFGTVPNERRIPWQVTGVPKAEENTVWQAFHGLYHLTQTRLAQSALLDWLALPPVADYYGLDTESIDKAAALLQQAGVFRGLDGLHRARQSGDSSDLDDTHTLLFGLERLLLAIALPPEFDGLVGGLQPVGGIEAGQFALIGTLVRAVTDLALRRDYWQQPRTVAEWLEQMRADLQQFLGHLAGEYALRGLERTMEAVGRQAENAEVSEAVPLFLLLREIEARLDSDVPEPLPGGAVTFSRVGALRNLPYRVVCLLGLEDTSFPRRDPFNEFDLLRQDDRPRPGDRSRRDDDRGAFLDALMSARDHLLLFYNGHSNNQSAEFPPSILIGELLDYLARRVDGGKDTVKARCCYEHRLQAFSPSYFHPDAGKMFSHARDWLPAAQSVLKPENRLPVFVNATLPPDDNARQLSLDLLQRFFKHPAEFSLTRCLKLRLESLDDSLHDEEPLQLNHLDKWQLRSRLFHARHQAEPVLRASGALPVGTVGTVYWEQAQQQLQDLQQAWERGRRDVTPERHDLTLGGYQLHVDLPPVSEPYQLGYQLSKQSAKYLVKAWLTHLLWQAAGAQQRTVWLFLDGPVLFAPLPRLQADSLLADWVDAYDRGQRQPLLLPPDPAWAYVQAAVKDEAKARFKLEQAWDEVVADSLWRQVLSAEEQERLPEAVTGEAVKLFGPMLGQLEKGEWEGLGAVWGGDEA